MLDHLPDDIRQSLIGLAGLLPTALLARLLWHRHEARAGRRRFWSPALLWELPTAILCAVMAGGVAEGLGLTGVAAQAVTGAVAWLGPRGLEHLLAAWIASRKA